MDLFEYQAKQLFQKYGVPVSLGDVATTPDEAEAIAAGSVVSPSSRRRSRSAVAARRAG